MIESLKTFKTNEAVIVTTAFLSDETLQLTTELPINVSH